MARKSWYVLHRSCWVGPGISTLRTSPRMEVPLVNIHVISKYLPIWETLIRKKGQGLRVTNQTIYSIGLFINQNFFMRLFFNFLLAYWFVIICITTRTFQIIPFVSILLIKCYAVLKSNCVVRLAWVPSCKIKLVTSSNPNPQYTMNCLKKD